MATVLDEIIAAKHREVAEAKRLLDRETLEKRVASAPPARDFFGAISRTGSINLIAEFKRRSPSAGEILTGPLEGVTVEEIVAGYQVAGAAAISVLTDATWFGGSLDDLAAAHAVSTVPVLRKEFVIDSLQVQQARAAGADAVLLIAECLDDCLLRSLHDEIVALGMTPLVELHSGEHLPRVLEAGATVIGINNRDLHTMTTCLDHVLELRDRVPESCTLVAESGIRTREDVLRLEAAGIDAMLVGESLLKSADPSAAAAALLGRA
jgi:indole-3-glycerol phosphate synthase